MSIVKIVDSRYFTATARLAENEERERERDEKHIREKRIQREENNIVRIERERERKRQNEVLYRSLILYITLEDETRARVRYTLICN